LVAESELTSQSRGGWRERVETGIYRRHRSGCLSVSDRAPGRRCGCAYTFLALGEDGSRQWVVVEGSLLEARKARARTIAASGVTPALTRAVPQTLHEFAGEWFRARSLTLRPATLEIHERSYSRRIAPHLGALRLDELNRARLDAWLSGLLRTDPARRSIEQAIATLRAMLSTALEWGQVDSNPALRLRMPKTRATNLSVERVLTPEQVERMLAHAGSARGETMLRAAVEAGLRKGEIIALRWPDVLLEDRRLVVRASIWQGRGGERVLLTPKSGRPRRVAISPEFAEAFAGYRAEIVSERGLPPSALVWPGRKDRPVGRKTPNQFLERILNRAGLIDGAGRPLVNFHGLRHTAASIAFARGVPLIAISRQLGHASVAVTSIVYAHLIDDRQLDAFAEAQRRNAEREPPDIGGR
jgi:integrase